MKKILCFSHSNFLLVLFLLTYPSLVIAQGSLFTQDERVTLNLNNSFRFLPHLYGTWIRVGETEALEDNSPTFLADEKLDWNDRITFFSSGKTSFGGNYFEDFNKLGVSISEKHGLYFIYIRKPSIGYIVYRKIPNFQVSGHSMAFVSDPLLLGTWREIDFVEEVYQFTPGKQFYSGFGRQPGQDRSGPYPLLIIHENGKTARNWISWTAGFFSDKGGNNKIYAYHIEKVGDWDYLFIEETSINIRGDHFLYVLKREQ